MSKTKYCVLHESFCGASVYGIRVLTEEKEIRDYPYISSAESDAITLVNQMQGGEVSPVHIDDIVSDYLYKLFYRKLQYNGLLKECS